MLDSTITSVHILILLPLNPSCLQAALPSVWQAKLQSQAALHMPDRQICSMPPSVVVLPFGLYSRRALYVEQSTRNHCNNYMVNYVCVTTGLHIWPLVLQMDSVTHTAARMTPIANMVRTFNSALGEFKIHKHSCIYTVQLLFVYIFNCMQ